MSAAVWVAAMCAIVVNDWKPAKPAERAMAVCLDVGAAAVAQGHDPALVIALAYTESRMDPTARSTRGASGALQVLPTFWCPRKRARGCDLVQAGVAALHRFRSRFGPDWSSILCHWNCGNVCYRRGRLFARTVMERAARLYARSVNTEASHASAAR